MKWIGEFITPEDRDSPTDEQMAAMEQAQHDAGEQAYLRYLDEPHKQPTFFAVTGRDFGRSMWAARLKGNAVQQAIKVRDFTP